MSVNPAILITGASSGIGRAAAEAFAQAGYTVYAASRRCTESTEPCGAGEILSLPVDVCDEAAVAQMAQVLRERGAPQIVMHCAGMGIAGAAEDTPEDEIRAQFEVNYFGVLRVNRHMLPLLRAQKSGLILLVSSVAGRVPLPFQSHYSATKYALDSYAEALRMELRPFGVRVALLEPGDTRTGFTAARRMAVPEDSPYLARCTAAVARMAHDEQNGYPPETVAKAALRLARRKHPPVRVTIGVQYKLVMLLRRILPAGLFEAALAALYG